MKKLLIPLISLAIFTTSSGRMTNKIETPLLQEAKQETNNPINNLKSSADNNQKISIDLDKMNSLPANDAAIKEKINITKELSLDYEGQLRALQEKISELKKFPKENIAKRNELNEKRTKLQALLEESQSFVEKTKQSFFGKTENGKKIEKLSRKRLKGYLQQLELEEKNYPNLKDESMKEQSLIKQNKLKTDIYNLQVALGDRWSTATRGLAMFTAGAIVFAGIDYSLDLGITKSAIESGSNTISKLGNWFKGTPATSGQTPGTIVPAQTPIISTVTATEPIISDNIDVINNNSTSNQQIGSVGDPIVPTGEPVPVNDFTPNATNLPEVNLEPLPVMSPQIPVEPGIVPTSEPIPFSDLTENVTNLPQAVPEQVSTGWRSYIPGFVKNNTGSTLQNVAIPGLKYVKDKFYSSKTPEETTPQQTTQTVPTVATQDIDYTSNMNRQNIAGAAGVGAAVLSVPLLISVKGNVKKPENNSQAQNQQKENK